ncbi:ATP-binding cassette sub-family G member 2 [Aphelenchoides besseyi]|nr:ATP-binding cassette sub-family G member 2 [Aphelenchoides besseyi]
MEDGLRSKLLANDEISIEMEEAVEADTNFHTHLPDQSSSRAKSEKTHSTVTQLPAMELSWENISAAPAENEERGWCAPLSGCCKSNSKRKQTQSTKTLILNNVYGIANAGEVLAILGPSGAGKTTLLNVLTQRNMSDLNVKGDVRINGIPMGGSAIRRMSAYVQQNDLFIGTMTVKEHLTFMVNLRMARNYTKRQREKRVMSVISDLSLQTCANTRIGWPHRLKGISGGERKRLAFASEILTSPPVLFCDEPTSGLDAFLALNVVEVLRNLAKQKGMTIVITIHQPSSQVFELFDRICLLVDGRNAFSGTTEQAIRHWKKLGEPLPPQFNPGDHFISTLDADDLSEKDAAEKIKNICDSFDQSEYGRSLLEAIRQSVSPQSSSSSASEVITKSIKRRQQYQASWIQQFLALTKRAFLVTVREPMLLRVRVFQTLISAVILGIVYFDTPIRQSTIINVNGLLFITTTNMNFMFQFASVGLFCEEYPILMRSTRILVLLLIDLNLRESSANTYAISSYFLAKNAADAVQYFIYPIVFSGVVYWMTGLYRSFLAFLFYTIMCILMTNVAISIAYAAACIFTRVEIAIAVLPIYVIPLMAFGGFFINQSTLPAYFLPLRYLSYFGFTFENLAINEWTHIKKIPGCSNGQNSTCRRTGYEVLDELSFSSLNFVPNIIYLLVMILVFRLIAYLALYIWSKKRR